MNKINQIWKKLKYWQIGGIIGLIFGLIVMNGYMSPFMTIFVALPYLILATLLWILNALPSDPLGPEGLAAIAIILSPLFYTVLGILMGIIVGKIKKKQQKQK